MISDISTAGYSWKLLREISLVAGKVYYFSVCGRDPGFILDKIVIRPVALGPTAGTGGNEGPNTTVYDDNANISMRMVMMGRTLRTANNFAWGSRLTRVTPPELYQTESGLYVPQNNQQKIRKLELTMPRMLDIDRFNMSLLEERNLGSPILVNAYPSKAEWFKGDYLMLGRFANELSYTHRFENSHSTQLTVFEA